MTMLEYLKTKENRAPLSKNGDEKMNQYRIFSKAGTDMGVYAGDTPEEAVRAMITDGSGEYGSESAGTVDDYDVYLEAARVLGRKGGQARSEAKTAAARQNAKKGGWPKGRPRKK